MDGRSISKVVLDHIRYDAYKRNIILTDLDYYKILGLNLILSQKTCIQDDQVSAVSMFKNSDTPYITIFRKL